MYRIALIQNQITMTYSSKTDVRVLLARLGYEVLLYTAHNIRKLHSDLVNEPIDALLFSSNCLNEPDIRAEVESAEFRAGLAQFLTKGKGCLVMHQMRLAEEGAADDGSRHGGCYAFLPDTCQGVRAVKRVQERPRDGDLKATLVATGHPALLYPNPVDLAALREHCREKKGLYWHYLTDLDASRWDVLLYDESDTYRRRALLAATHESARHRVIVSALNLDWQKEERLLGNLLLYAIEGRRHTAVLKDWQLNDTSFDYLLATLDSRHLRYQIYDYRADLTEFRRRAAEGLHSVAILGPHKPDLAQLANGLRSALQEQTHSGHLKLLGVDHESDRFFISGRERFSLSIQIETELKLQDELKAGWVDGSFWSTVEALKTLRSLKQCYSSFGPETVEPVFVKSQSKFLAEGSFDGNFSPTVALLWLRATYRGTAAEETRQTLFWLRRALPAEEPREQVMALTTLVELGLADAPERRRLEQLLLRQQQADESEIGLAYSLKGALLLESADLTHAFVNRFCQLLTGNPDRLRIDLSTSATILSLLLAALDRLRAWGRAAEVEEPVERLLFAIVLQIQGARRQVQDGTLYAWENKAMTTLKCVAALLQFEDLIDLPVAEMARALFSYAGGGTEQVALRVVEEFKKENVALLAEGDALKTKAEQFAKERDQLADANEGLRRQVQSLKNSLDEQAKTIGSVERYQWHSRIAAGAVVLLALIAGWGGIFFSVNPPSFSQALAFVKDYKDFIWLTFGLLPGALTVHHRSLQKDRAVSMRKAENV